MSRIDDIFSSQQASNRSTLMPFITAGYPSIEMMGDLLAAIERAGAPIVEIGFPFSDPIADGPIIASSMHEALAAGVTPRKIFDIIARIRSTTQLGLIALVSISIVNKIGCARFIDDAKSSGFDGLIIPDLDSNNANSIVEHVDKAQMSLALLISPSTPANRLADITCLCRGFVYMLARTGITGERKALPDLSQRVAEIRSVTKLPIAVGFGISTPKQAAVASQHTDAVIVGSALVKRLGNATDPVREAECFVGELVAAMR